MKRILVAGLAAMALASLPGMARAQAEQQELVDRATLAAQDILGHQPTSDAQDLLRRARAVLICPRVFRAGFIIGGQGGSCVLLARGGAGSWSDPAFYGMGAGSIGFQAGIQDAEIMMMILTQRGLNAIIDDHFKIGAGADITFVTFGAGVEGATTAAVGADIVAFARNRGLFAGVSLSGSMLGSRSNWNAAYYGRPLGAEQIVIEMQANNPGADPLRAVLTRAGSPYPEVTAAAASAPAYPAAAPTYPPAAAAAAAPTSRPLSLAPVQQESLPPPK